MSYPQQYENPQHAPSPGGLDVRSIKGGKEFRGDCPLCNGKDCFTLRPGKSLPLVPKCFKCNDFNGLLALIKTIMTGSYTAPISKTPTDSDKEFSRRRRALERLWNESKPIEAGDPVDLYLRNRGIPFDLLGAWPADLQCHPKLEYRHQEKNGEWVTLGEFPALVALVRNIRNGGAVSIQRIWIKEDGSGKADVPKDKKLMPPLVPGATMGCAIRLANPSNVLCVTEGIETGLGVMSQLGIPTWAAVSAGGMEALEVPASVRELQIAADNDLSGRGKEAAEKLAWRMRRCGVVAKISMPDVVGQDWLDVLVARNGGNSGTERTV